MISMNPRPPVNQGIDRNNATVLKHSEIEITLLYELVNSPGHMTFTLNPFGTAPLSGLLGTYTTSLNPIQVTITDDKGSIPVKYSYTPARTGPTLVPMVGFTPDATNNYEVFVPYVGTRINTVRTPPLPPTDAELPPNPDSDLFPGFPTCEVTIPSTDIPATISELYFISIADRYNVGYDPNGTVRWYTKFDMPAGNPERFANGHFYATSFKFDTMKILYEFDMVGQVYNVYISDNRIHHSVYQMPDGNMLIPSEYTGTTLEDGISIVDINTGLETAYYDMRDVMDTNREPVPKAEEAHDWLHINQTYYNATNNLFVSSARHQGVFAINVDSSELVFILANKEGWNASFQQYLLTPVDASGIPLYDLSDPQDIEKADKEFWPWGQHAVYEVPNTNQGIVELILLDNGNFRSRSEANALIPNDNYSRLVHYKIDIKSMTVMKVYEYGEVEVGNKGYSSYVSSVQILDNGNYFINFGGIIMNENGRLDTILPGFSDIIDPQLTDTVQGQVLAQEINPATSTAIIELKCTPGKYLNQVTDGPAYRTAFFSFRSHKLPLIPK